MMIAISAGDFMWADKSDCNCLR